MRRTFSKLLTVDLKLDDEDRYVSDKISVRIKLFFSVVFITAVCVSKLAHFGCTRPLVSI